MKSQRKSLKQTTLLQYSSPVKGSSSPIRKPKKRVPQESDGNDSDGLRNMRLERPSSDEDEDDEKSHRSATSSSASDDEDEAIPIPTPRRSKSRFAVKSESEEDSDDLPLTTLKSRGKKPAKRPAPRDSNGEDEDEDPQPKRRRLTRHKTIIVHEISDEDSADDVEDLDSDSVLPTRLRTRGTKSSFQKTLEKYASKRKKGKSAATVSSEDEEEEEEALPPRRLFKGAKPSKGTVDSDSDEEEDEEGSEEDSASEDEEDEDSWIIEDDPIAAPCLPAQFSMETHQDLGHQYKKVFQLLVHVAVQPPKKRKKHMEELLEREGDYFKAPLAMVRRKLDGLRDSAVASSVWRPDFKKALERFPEFSLTMMDFGVPGCDACHLGGRMSTRKGAVSGEPYNKLGFEPQKRSSSEKKADKRLKKQFDLGRFCAARTEVFHQFCHWEHDTFKIIERQVDELKTGSFCRIAYAGGRKPPKDLTDADGILEWLDERGIVDNQWQLVKAMMDRARNLESEGRRGGDD
ncbi:hypothetical protein BKA70DRAFT_1247487 [Coprinopsis sp. MPI-PUGE-AT-0042]|nr:hypothetical protein BKA70DRAFT_1247487 [Coprinopsis sp. MPI-PUGE-AT-0042]